MSVEFLTGVLGIPIGRLAATVFEGYGQIPEDREAYEIWRRAGLRGNQLYFYGMNENWWGPVGATGPCGPDTEIFFDTGAGFCNDNCGPACGCGKFVEIWNNVFMQYNKLADGSFALLDRQNVDTGMSLERILAVYNGLESNYDTDVFAPIIRNIESLTGLAYPGEKTREFRIVADHMRAAAFILGDGVSQRGSNINEERLRFDFSFGRKMMADELAAVERIVNQAISEAINVECEEMPAENAVSSGAIGVFEQKYGEIVKVYTINGYSKEICGGPHAKNTAELVSFKIVKEESSSAGVRRIKAVIG